MNHSTKEQLKSAIKNYFNLKESVTSQRKYNSNLESYKEINNKYIMSKTDLGIIIRNLCPEEKADDLIALAIKWSIESEKAQGVFKREKSLESVEILKSFAEAEERLKLYYSMNLRSNLSSSALNKSML